MNPARALLAKLAATLVLSAAPAICHASAPPASAALPVARTDEKSLLAHGKLVEKAKAGDIDLYFLGDSITRRWGCSDPEYADLRRNWDGNFRGWKVGNFGWGGDTTQNMLWRIRNGELDGVHPKVIVILAGTNNVGKTPGGEAKVADIVEGIRALVAACREKAPAAKIILTAIFPRNDSSAVLPEIASINRQLAADADGKTLFFLNVNDRLASPDGVLHEGMSNDGLHLTVQAYQVWADGLTPLLTELLGPRAPAEEGATPVPDDRGSVRPGGSQP